MNLLARLGLGLPQSPDVAAAAVAALVAALSLLAAWLAGRSLGPRLSNWWERRAGGRRAEGIAPRMCAIVRHACAWLLLSLALNFHAWPPVAALILGIMAAGAAALLIVNIVRGVHLAGWLAWVLGTFLFLVVLADANGGLERFLATLDQTGFTIGQRRFTVLGLLRVGITLLVLYTAVRIANRLVGQSVKHSESLDPAQQLLAQKLLAIAIAVVAFFIGIDIIGIDLTALAVFSGALGLAVGFGLQKTFGNLIAGIILLWDRSIKPGDVIVVGDSFGTVNKIGIRAVSVITRDGKEHLIPNEDLMTREVENWSYSSSNVRIHVPVGIAYDCDVQRAQALMIEAAKASSRVLKTPPPTVWLRGFGESSVDFEILAWIADPQAGVGGVQSEILNRLWVLFQENGIQIPFPQRDIRIKEWPAGAPPPGPQG